MVSGIGRTTIAAILGMASLTAASAADMALKAPPPPPAPAWSWTGCYAGIEGGGVWGKQSVTNIDTVTGVNGGPITNVSPRGGLFGGTVGCNYQMTNIVIGIENDLSWDGLRGSANDQPPFNIGFTHGLSTSWLDTLRGRVGVVVGSGLLYATGGAAFTAIKDTATGVAATVPPTISGTTSTTGWTAGGGIEYMFAPQWSAKAEYLYVRFPTIHDAFDTATGGLYSGASTRLTENILRVGINYHFNLLAAK